jgi:hypothetical protein
MRSVALALLLTAAAAPAAAQMADDVQTPRVEVSAAEPIYTSALGGSHWTAVGADVSLTRNVSERAGVEFQVLRTIGTTWLWAGPRLTTGFFYGSERDPIPGRFFVELAGGASVTGRDGRTRPAMMLGAGTDLLIAPRRGVSLRWELIGHTQSADPVDPSRYQLVVGLLFGPRERTGRAGGTGRHHNGGTE